MKHPLVWSLTARVATGGASTAVDARAATGERPIVEAPQDSQAEALAVLGLKRGASREAIKQAFRQRVKEHHPDVGGSAEAFRRVSEAYQQLIQ